MNVVTTLANPDISIIRCPEISAVVTADFEREMLYISQPKYLGDSMVKPMDDFTNFEGDMIKFVLSLRGSNNV